MAKQFSAIRSAAIDGRLQNPIYRKDQLRFLHSGLADNASSIQDAIAKDSRNQTSEVKVEYCLALQTIADAYNSINPDQQLEEEYSVKKGQDDLTAREPVGVVVIEPAAHAWFYGLISALAVAIAAGNCVIVQSENSLRETPKLVLNLIQTSLDRDIFATSTQPVTPEDLNTPHILVSQNGSTGPILRNHLVSDPKAPVIAFVERDADIASAAQALVSARFTLQGKAPYAPDVVLVNEWVKKDLLKALVQKTTEVLAAPAKGRTVRTGLSREVEKDDSVHVVLSGSNGVILDVQNRSSSLLKQKVEETTLIVHSVTSMDDAIDASRDVGSLAAAYVFTTPSMAKYTCQFLDTAVSYVNQIPTQLLYSPIAPAGSPPQANTNAIYTEDLFSRPKPKYLSKSSTDEKLTKILGTSTAADLRALEVEATKRLPEMKRRLKGTQLGFFEQGIVTSLALRKKEPCEGLADVIACLVFATMFAALESTTLTMTHTLFNLCATDPAKKVWKTLEEEGRSAFSAKVDQSTVNNLKYADSAIKETLRLHTSIKALGVQVMQPTGLDLKGYDIHLPQGSRVSVPVWGIHHDEDIYPAAHNYEAFRFVQDGGSKDSLVSTSENYLSFGLGKHSCPGRNFAAIAMKLFLAYLAGIFPYLR
ncbi:uncharacterized protein FIESC28_00478 [Fusarium coffeatum]|uniref:Aldehyde dehydrogenase domain-containing protein n=1 Tax=Fusarium coffeatum TaxID=231269 RepID=A0A366SDG6_9HYPO|nr:uncharacterized protein FIESC28_00478 [Fusarium coffeatum]RBR26695.1 hypothetical protein FIESC28_00478 [Fusarium coffeatum]